MTIPNESYRVAEPMDPSDLVDVLVDLRGLLEDNEQVQSFSVVLLPEAVAVGLTIATTGEYITKLVNGYTGLLVWLQIDPNYVANDVFIDGIWLPFEVTVKTSSIPARRRQRTVLVEVKQL